MLKINDLNVSYGASQVLFGVDLEANLGEISCVLGRNGVGKTSLVRAVAGVICDLGTSPLGRRRYP